MDDQGSVGFDTSEQIQRLAARVEGDLGYWVTLENHFEGLHF
jgi:hypothetical protein